MTRFALMAARLSLVIAVATPAQAQFPLYLDPDPERAAAEFGLGAPAAVQLPREGTYAFTLRHAGTVKVLRMGEERWQVTYEMSGVSLSDGGGGPLHRASVRCLGALHAIRGIYDDDHGFCVHVRPDGDQAFTTYRGAGTSGEGGAGIFTFVGGTGKLKGLTGGGEYSGTSPHSSSAGSFHGYSKAKASWKLP
jgi:hypothetical protein